MMQTTTPGVSAAVRVLAVSRVASAEHAVSTPGKVKLTFLDAPWIGMPPVQTVFLYELGSSGGDEFPAAVARLKESLACALAAHVLLAGRLAYVAGTGDVVVDCSGDAAGVLFVEAEAPGMDVRRVAADEAPDVPALLALCPAHDARVLPAPVMAVQATRLGAAGLALGLSVHHTVADARSMRMFFHAWASASRRGSVQVATSLTPPDYARDREAVARAHPRGDDLARELLHKAAPNLPVASTKQDYFTQGTQLARRTFFFTAADVRSLKRRMNVQRLASSADEAHQPPPTAPVSTFAALVAVVWIALARAKGLAAGDVAALVFYADLRARLRPPVGDHYVGNCARPCIATVDAGELLAGSDDAGLLRAAREVQAAVRELDAAPLAGVEAWLDRLRSLPPTRLLTVGGDPLLRSYEAADFGFGRPSRVEAVTMIRDGKLMLRGGKRDGEVQVTVALDPAHMDAFKAHIYNSVLRTKI